MKNEQKPKPFARSWLLSLVKICPQAAKPEMGTEAFITDLIKANEKLKTLSPETAGAINELAEFFKTCPHIFKPGIGLEALIDDLTNGVEKYFPYMDEGPPLI